MRKPPDPDKKRAYWRKWYYAHREQICAAKRIREKAYWAKRPEELLWRNARARAKLHGLPFNLEITDIVIPEVCQVLGIKLQQGEKKFGPASPSLDREVPELGYVRGNVLVISWRANELKSNATPAELMAIATWVNRRRLS